MSDHHSDTDLTDCITAYIEGWIALWKNNESQHSHFMVRYYEYLLEHGEVMTPDMEKTRSLLKQQYREPKVKACYHNSLLMRFVDGQTLDLYEGFIIRSDLTLPIEHGWNRDSDGTAIDFTATIWERNDCQTVLFGCHVPDEFAMQMMNETSQSGPYLFKYANRETANV
jgi:hypothetical protein